RAGNRRDSEWIIGRRFQEQRLLSAFEKRLLRTEVAKRIECFRSRVRLVIPDGAATGIRKQKPVFFGRIGRRGNRVDAAIAALLGEARGEISPNLFVEAIQAVVNEPIRRINVRRREEPEGAGTRELQMQKSGTGTLASHEE